MGLNYWARTIALEMYYMIPGMRNGGVSLSSYLFLTTTAGLIAAAWMMGWLKKLTAGKRKNHEHEN